MRQASSALDRTFSALSDPTRRAILSRLAGGESSVGKLAAPFNMSLPAVSKHLRVLEEAGLLRRKKDGRVRRCRLSPGAMKEASDWLGFYQKFWEAQFDSLENYLNNIPEEKPE